MLLPLFIGSADARNIVDARVHWAATAAHPEIVAQIIAIVNAAVSLLNHVEAQMDDGNKTELRFDQPMLKHFVALADAVKERS